MLKRVIGIGVTLALMAPVGVITAGAAGAAPLVKCAKPSGSVTFVPGLGKTPKIQTVKFNLPVKNCTGPGGVKSGKSAGSSKGTTKQNCATFATTGKTVTNVTIKWNTGKSSAAKLTTTVKAQGNALTATVSGKVNKGLFKGKVVKTKVKVTIPKTAKCTDQAPLKKATLTGLAPLTIG
jgi:hypothetical protein